MAYSLYEETQLNSSKPVQYYPEQYDYPSYYHKISEVKVDYTSDHATKKNKKAAPSINYINERKCPIYVHQYHNIQTPSTYNYSKPAPKPPVEKNYSPKPKKIPGFPTTKSVLDQLEETYWATWKPNNKDNAGTMPKKNKIQDNRMSKMKAYGDVPDVDNMVHYFASSEYETTAVSTVEESDYETYDTYETIIDMRDACESGKNLARPKPTLTQEIQTDNIALMLPKIEEYVEKDEIGTKEEVKEEPKSEEKDILTDKSSDEDPDETAAKDKSKLLKHTDSFIINKKKQGEVKEHFQQPKCIRLYRKPGISTSFIRGGSYPLKSCLKKEPVPKGNFRLGAPGSPLFVSTSSFHRKTRK